MLRIHWTYIFPLLATVFGLIFIPNWTVDDAFISYRYAHNWVNLGELNWNVGQPFVEGYTGIFLVTLSGLILKVGLHIALSIKALSFVSAAFTAGLIAKILHRSEVKREIVLGILCLYLLSPMLYVHAFSGLETNFFILFSLALLDHLLMLNGRPLSAWQKLVGFLSLTGLLLVRPEGILLSSIALSAWGFLHFRNAKRRSRTQFLVLLAVGSVVLALYAWFKYSLYGSFFPNTYYAKQYPGGFNPDSAWEFLRFGGYYLALPGILGLLSWFRGRRRPVPNGFGFILLTFAAFVGLSCFIYFRSYLFMNYGHRFFYPFWPVFLVLLGFSIDRGWFKRPFADLPIAYRVFPGMVLLLHLSVMGYRFSEERTYLLDYNAVMEAEWKPTAEFLQISLPKGSSLICYQDAGWVPFETEFVTYDFGRLNDRYLAKENPEPAEAADYFFSLQADAVVMSSWSAAEYQYWDEGVHIQGDPRMAQNYFLARVFDHPGDYAYAQWVYLRRSGQ